MLPSNGIGDTDKTCYPGSPEYKFKYGSEGFSTTDIKEYIRNPHKFNINTDMDGVYYNLWSTDNDKTVPNDDVVIKSVYDPSPVGYSLPAANAFTGFTTTGQNVGDGNIGLFNVKDNWDNGWYFYTKPNKQGNNTIYFPASGYRNRSQAGVTAYTSEVGFYWTAIPYSNTQAIRLIFGTNGINPIHNLGRGWAFPVRSAEEKKLCLFFDQNFIPSVSIAFDF